MPPAKTNCRRITQNTSKLFIPTDPAIYAARLQHLQAVVHDVDRTMGWRPRVVRGEPGEIPELVEIKGQCRDH